MILRVEEVRAALRRARKDQDLKRIANRVGVHLRALDQPETLTKGARALLTAVLVPSDIHLVPRLSSLLNVSSSTFMRMTEWPSYKHEEYSRMDTEAALSTPQVQGGILRAVKIYDMRHI